MNSNDDDSCDTKRTEDGQTAKSPRTFDPPHILFGISVFAVSLIGVAFWFVGGDILALLFPFAMALLDTIVILVLVDVCIIDVTAWASESMTVKGYAATGISCMAAVAGIVPVSASLDSLSRSLCATQAMISGCVGQFAYLLLFCTWAVLLIVCAILVLGACLYVDDYSCKLSDQGSFGEMAIRRGHDSDDCLSNNHIIAVILARPDMGGDKE